MGINKEIASLTVREMTENWGGNLPSWEEFKAANRNGRVRANKTIAAQAIYMKGMPKGPVIVFGVITIWLGFLLFPAIIVAWLFTDFSALWILGSLLAAWFLVKVSREGQCEAVKAGAEGNEHLYQKLINTGAFLFEPVE